MREKKSNKMFAIINFAIYFHLVAKFPSLFPYDDRKVRI